MNYHILSAFHRTNGARLLPLLTVMVLAAPGVMNSFAQEADQSIMLATNKEQYLPGDIVQLSGTVSGQPNALVGLQIKDSTGNLILIRTVQSDQNGNFALQFKIPSTATSGDFSIIASSKINGFVVTQTKTMTATVPEFGPLAMPLFGVSILLIVGLFAFSKNLLQTTT
ncbi:exported protein of unknown function [Nitrosotalea devaniterrae]|uniref:Macroglobulin domain-containing protein n=1 Tax=Nitrosotalea devaniterrae TaxID=1078905 RepID=A0A128A3S9_9ARCH|nr:exported protein of unknown function [Candidatus Nitrosotalea devanaterra]